MKLQRAAYAFVEPGGIVPVPTIQPIPPEIESYLNDHRSDLVDRARTDKVTEAHFVDLNANDRFVSLATGTDNEFLKVAQSLAERLHAGMDARTKRGFFVVATFADDGAAQSMVLKLDASPKKLAAIGGTAAKPILESVEDLLDVPGELQKGAVYPDPRPHSDVCVADKSREAALYYLNAIEVEQHELPGKAVSTLLGIVHELSPAHIEPVIAALENASGRTTAAAVLQDVTPPIPQTTRDAITGRLATLRRPVSDVDPTSHSTRGVVEVDGMTIRGPASRIRDDVTFVRDQSGTGYIIQVHVSHQPTKRYE